MDLLKSNIKKLYFKYLVASMGSAIVMSIYSFVDTIAVGQSEGPNGAAAMAVITPLYGVTVFLAILCGIGGSVLMSKEKGEGNDRDANAFFTTALITMGALTVIFWLFLALFAEDIFLIFGANETIMPLVMKYAKWIIIFCPKIGYRGQTYTFDKMAGLAEAKDNYPLGKLEKLFRQADLLVWDKMVCKIVSNPSERGDAMVAALVDWLTSKSFVPDRNGDSFRRNQPLKP